MNGIEVLNLNFEYSNCKILNDISFNISQGQTIAILGSNGSGKSTLVKHLNALLLPTNGDVIIDGNNTNNENLHIDIRKNVGIIFQNVDNQIIGTTVEDDIAFGMENISVDSDEMNSCITEMLELFDIEHYRETSPHNLSGGEKQRLAIASILAMKPKYIIFDEATSMLDPYRKQEVLSIAKQLNKEHNITIIWITHDMNEVVSFDNIIVLDKGSIVMQGSPKEIFLKVDMLRSYGLDIPLATSIAYELKNKGYNISGTILKMEELIEVLCLLN